MSQPIPTIPYVAGNIKVTLKATPYIDISDDEKIVTLQSASGVNLIAIDQYGNLQNVTNNHQYFLRFLTQDDQVAQNICLPSKPPKVYHDLLVVETANKKLLSLFSYTIDTKEYRNMGEDHHQCGVEINSVSKPTLVAEVCISY